MSAQPKPMGSAGRGRARTSVALAALAVACGPAAAQPVLATGLTDFATICIASLMEPEALEAALKQRGLVNPGPLHLPPGWDGEVYGAPDGTRGISVGYQRYTDLKITTCTATVPAVASNENLVELRTAIEAHPRIGKLEGRIVTAMPGVQIATFKRPGNAPIVTFRFTTSGKATSLAMNRWDLQPEI